MDTSDTLTAELREAERALEATLDQACSSDVSRADTGELIRIDEMLAIASEAAKKAISIRRRRHLDRAESPQVPQLPVATAVRRQFTDDEGATWAAWAVHPDGRRRLASARLVGDLQRGWLTFECGTSKRRLSPIPAGWEQLDDPGLRALLRQAQDAPVLRRRDDAGD